MALEIDENRRAILDCKRNLLVIGGPGCGKTTIALAKAFSYIREQSLNRGEKILFLSFSRNARARILESAENFPDFKELGAKLYVQTFLKMPTRKISPNSLRDWKTANTDWPKYQD